MCLRIRIQCTQQNYQVTRKQVADTYNIDVLLEQLYDHAYDHVSLISPYFSRQSFAYVYQTVDKIDSLNR